MEYLILNAKPPFRQRSISSSIFFSQKRFLSSKRFAYLRDVLIIKINTFAAFLT